MTAPWLVGMPATWREVPLKYLARIETGSRDTVDAVADGAYPFIVRSPQPLAINSFSFDTEAILTPGDGAVGEIFHHVKGRFEAHQRVYVIRSFRGIHPRFLYYYFLTQFRQTVAHGGAQTTVPSLRRPMFTTFPVAVPPISVQRAIADFLDKETVRLDALLEKSEELIGLLKERRVAAADTVLEQYIGSGKRVKASLQDIDVRAGDNWAELPLLSVSISWGVRRRDSVTSDQPAASDLSNYKVAEPGDIVLNRMRAFQGALGVAPERGLVSPDYAVLRARPDTVPEWFARLMKTTAFVAQMSSRLKGIGSTSSGAVRTPRISVPDLGEIRVQVPSFESQRAMARSIAKSEAKDDAAMRVANHATALVRERRTALISAAVTGIIDVGVEG